MTQVRPARRIGSRTGRADPWYGPSAHRATEPEERAVARIHYETDGPVAPERFIAALTDFSDRRPQLWPGLDAKFFKVHTVGDTWAEVTEGTDVLGGVWPRRLARMPL